MLEKEINKKTRDIYLKQHNQYLSDETTFNRFINMVNDASYFHLSSEDFIGKDLLDAGCGNTGYFQVVMNGLGINKMTCLDLGSDWIKPLKEFLENKGITNVEYIEGSTDALPFPDESFDMVFSNGVLPHLANQNQIDKAFSELARVTKKGGYLYIIAGCPGGLFEEAIFPAMREYYNQNNDFKNLIDHLTPETFLEMAELVSTSMKINTGEECDPNNIKKYCDIDFCTTLQNILQVPKRLVFEMSEDYIINKYKELGFGDIHRCKRYVKRKNLRKFFAPLHFDHENKFSKILYGPGNLEFIAKKK